jgi:hypothetical protein
MLNWLRKIPGLLSDLLCEYAAPIMFEVMFGIGFTAGWYVNGWRWEIRHARLEVRYATLEATHAKADAAQSRAILDAVEQVREMEKQGDAIAARLIEAEAARNQLARERDDAIRAQTTGRACLDADLVSLLNESTGMGFRLPSTTGDAAAANSAFAPDSTLYASDTDIALWAAFARDQHDTCRKRIDALRGWYEIQGTGYGLQPHPHPSLPLEGEGGSPLYPVTRTLKPEEGLYP